MLFPSFHTMRLEYKKVYDEIEYLLSQGKSLLKESQGVNCTS